MAESDWVLGLHAVMAALKAGRVEQLFYFGDRHDKRMGQILDQARKANIGPESLSRQDLAQLCRKQGLGESAKHQGVVARLKVATALEESDLIDLLEQRQEQGKAAFVLALDGVQDPHNLGACLRSADGAGVDAVIAPKDRSVALTPTVRKVACGATESVPFIALTNLSRTLEKLKQMGLWVLGADEAGEQALYEHDLTGPVVLVLGAEGQGLRRLSKEKCDFLIRLPMQGVVESLNVSVATGICLYEVLRQRQFGSDRLQ